MSFEEEKVKQREIITAKDIEKIGHTIAGSQIYHVLKRHGFIKVMLRSKHPKKTNEEEINDPKKLTNCQKS